MEKKEFSGKNVEDAIINAKQELGLTSEELEYEVIEKGGKGFLGLGSKEAVILAWKKGQSEIENAIDVKDNNGNVVDVHTKSDNVILNDKKDIEPIDVKEYFEKAENFVKEVTSKMNEDVDITIKEGDEVNSISIDLEGENMGLFIGKRGQTLDALQYLTSLVVNQDSKSYIRVKLDTEDYRNRRKNTLENLALNMAKKAVRLNRRVALEPMNPYERRIIHAYLQPNSKVDTFSEGVEPYRKVVIIPNK